MAAITLHFGVVLTIQIKSCKHSYLSQNAQFTFKLYRAAKPSLTAGTCLTADPGVASLILDRSHIFVEINHEIISMVIVLPPAGSTWVVVSYKRYITKSVFTKYWLTF